MNKMTSLKNEAIWPFVIRSFQLSYFNFHDAANPMLISFSFSKLLLSLRSKFFMSVANSLFCSRSGFTIDKINFLNSFCKSLYMYGIIGWSIWYMTRNGSNKLAKKEKNCSLAGVTRSSTADLRCSWLFDLGLFGFGNFSQWFTRATICFHISTRRSATALSSTHLYMNDKKIIQSLAKTWSQRAVFYLSAIVESWTFFS